jgi:hypothetical protein
VSTFLPITVLAKHGTKSAALEMWCPRNLRNATGTSAVPPPRLSDHSPNQQISRPVLCNDDDTATLDSRVLENRLPPQSAHSTTVGSTVTANWPTVTMSAPTVTTATPTIIIFLWGRFALLPRLPPPPPRALHHLNFFQLLHGVSKQVIEPLVSAQWFVKMDPLAKPALAAVDSGELKIVPPRFEKVRMRVCVRGSFYVCAPSPSCSARLERRSDPSKPVKDS